MGMIQLFYQIDVRERKLCSLLFSFLFQEDGSFTLPWRHQAVLEQKNSLNEIKKDESEIVPKMVDEYTCNLFNSLKIKFVFILYLAMVSCILFILNFQSCFGA